MSMMNYDMNMDMGSMGDMTQGNMPNMEMMMQMAGMNGQSDTTNLANFMNNMGNMSNASPMEYKMGNIANGAQAMGAMDVGMGSPNMTQNVQNLNVINNGSMNGMMVQNSQKGMQQVANCQN
jgi:hypothetical protein